jgi:cytochrome c oxidase subunit 1
MGWDHLNLAATIGASTLALGILVTLVNAVLAARRGRPAGPDPWGAGTLEWATASPPTPANFHVVPIVYGPYPLWQPPAPGEPTHVRGLAAQMREHLITTVVDAAPDHRTNFPVPTPWPFLAAIATTILFVGLVFTPWAAVWGTVPLAVALTAWFWPRRGEVRQALAVEKSP